MFQLDVEYLNLLSDIQDLWAFKQKTVEWWAATNERLISLADCKANAKIKT